MKKNPQRSKKPREREQRSANVVYGVMPVLELMRSHPSRVERLVIASGAGKHRLREIFEIARKSKVRIDMTDQEQMKHFAGVGANHQGVLAIAAAADYVDADAILDALNEEDAMLLLLDGVEDPRNLGAILRTAECAGVGGVFIPERRAVGLTDTVAKSSAGAVEHVKMSKIGNLNNFIADLKKMNIWVVGTDMNAETTHTEWDWSRPFALVLGGEGRGLHRLVAENCDVLVKIPMYGRIDSLNVSVAAGVILFEACRQRKEKLETKTDN